MRRKRRNRGAWLPVNGVNFVDGEDQLIKLTPLFGVTQEVSTFRAFAVVDCLPIVPDQTILNDSAQPLGATLRDIVNGQDWLCQRIVGNIFIDCLSGAGNDTPPIEGRPDVVWPNVFVSVGIFVARATDDEQGIVDLSQEEVTPDLGINAQESWLWRNTYYLENPALNAAGETVQGVLTDLTTNRYGATLFQSPRIDTKIKRRITREHRLWFVLAARGWSPLPTVEVSGAAAIQPQVSYTADLRVYGSLRAPGRKSSSF